MGKAPIKGDLKKADLKNEENKRSQSIVDSSRTN